MLELSELNDCNSDSYTKFNSYIGRHRQELSGIFLSCHPDGEWEYLWEQEELHKDLLKKKLNSSFPLIGSGNSDITMIEKKMGLVPNSLRKIDISNINSLSGIKLGDISFIVISGSVYDIRESLIFKDQLFEFIRIAHTHNIPLLGICFGHQVLASALIGEHVIHDTNNLQVGPQNIHILPFFQNSDFFSSLPNSFKASSFNKQIVNFSDDNGLSDGFKVCATDDNGNIQCIYWSDVSLGTQFHLEQENGFLLQTEVFRDYLYNHGLNDAEIDELQSNIVAQLGQTNLNGEKILKNFLKNSLIRKE